MAAPQLSLAATRTLTTLITQVGTLQPTVPTLPPATSGVAGFKLWKGNMSVLTAPMARVPDPQGPAISDVFRTEGIGPLPPPLPEYYVLSPEEVQDDRERRDLILTLTAAQAAKATYDLALEQREHQRQGSDLNRARSLVRDEILKTLVSRILAAIPPSMRDKIGRVPGFLRFNPNVPRSNSLRDLLEILETEYLGVKEGQLEVTNRREAIKKLFDTAQNNLSLLDYLRLLEQNERRATALNGNVPLMSRMELVELYLFNTTKGWDSARTLYAEQVRLPEHRRLEGFPVDLHSAYLWLHDYGATHHLQHLLVTHEGGGGKHRDTAGRLPAELIAALGAAGFKPQDLKGASSGGPTKPGKHQKNASWSGNKVWTGPNARPQTSGAGAKCGHCGKPGHFWKECRQRLTESAGGAGPPAPGIRPVSAPSALREGNRKVTFDQKTRKQQRSVIAGLQSNVKELETRLAHQAEREKEDDVDRMIRDQYEAERSSLNAFRVSRHVDLSSLKVSRSVSTPAVEDFQRDLSGFLGRMKHTWIEAHTDASFDTHSDRYHKTGQAIMIGRATDYGSFTRTRIEVDKARLEGLRLLRHETEVRVKLEKAHPTDPKRVYEVYQQIRRMRGLLAEIQEWNPAALIKVEACQVSPIRGGEVDLGKGLAEIDYVDQAESVPDLLATPIIAAVNTTVPSETPEEDRAFAKFMLMQNHLPLDDEDHQLDSGATNHASSAATLTNRTPLPKPHAVHTAGGEVFISGFGEIPLWDSREAAKLRALDLTSGTDKFGKSIAMKQMSLLSWTQLIKDYAPSLPAFTAEDEGRVVKMRYRKARHSLWFVIVDSLLVLAAVTVEGKLRWTRWNREDGKSAVGALHRATTGVLDSLGKSPLQLRIEDAKLTKREWAGVQEVRRIRDDLMSPSEKDLRSTITNGGIRNAITPVSQRDYELERAIYGPDPATLAGRATVEKSNIARPLWRHPHLAKEIVLTGDVFFWAKLPYFLSVSIGLGYSIVTLMASRSATEFVKAMTSHVRMYLAKGFKVTTMLHDREAGAVASVEALAELGVDVSLSASGSHNPIPEARIRRVKERARCGESRVLITTGLTVFPRRFNPSLIAAANIATNNTRSSINLDPTPARELFLGRPYDRILDAKAAFMEYVLARNSIDPKDSNTERARVVGCLQLGPTGQMAGGNVLYNLTTETTIVRSQFTSSPIPDSVIKQLKAFAEIDAENEPDDDDEEKVSLDTTALEDSEHRSDREIGLGEKMMERLREAEDYANDPSYHNDDRAPKALEKKIRASRAAKEKREAELLRKEEQERQRQEQMAQEKKTANNQARKEAMGQQRSSLYSIAENAYVEDDIQVNHISVKKSIEQFGEAETERALEKEIQSMLDKNVFKFKHRAQLSREELGKVLQNMILMDGKTHPNGDFDKLKARLLLNGAQQDKESYNSVYSPTIDTTTLFLALGIAAHENHQCAAYDIGTAFLNADKMKGVTIHTHLKGLVVTILLRLIPSLAEYVDSNGGILAEVVMNIYGLIEGPKNWFEELKKWLVGANLTQNPHDKCLWMGVIYGFLIYVLIHVDDLLVITSDKGTTVLDNFELGLKKRFEKITIQRGRILEYLGMNLDFRQPKRVLLTQSGYVAEIVDGYRVSGTSKLPADDELMIVDEKSEIMNDSEHAQFRSRVMKVAYLSKRTRPDLLTAIAFLTTRISAPTKQDGVKLTKLLQYIKHTREIGLCIDPTDLQVSAMADASLGTGPNRKSRTGWLIRLGSAYVMSRSVWQKIVSRSSFESELIALDDVLSILLWCRQILESLGHPQRPSIIQEDNKATIRVLENGQPNAERSRHVDIKFFWAHQLMLAELIKLQYVESTSNVADYFTKPITSPELFQRYTRLLLHWPDKD